MTAEEKAVARVRTLLVLTFNWLRSTCLRALSSRFPVACRRSTKC